MRTLFFLSLAVFAVSAVTWFFVWAIWIHAREAWYEPPPDGGTEQLPEPTLEPAPERHAAWYKGLKRMTAALFAVSVALGLAAYFRGELSS